MSTDVTTDVVGCCVGRDPCEVVCMLQTALADKLMGRMQQSYRIGEESFTLSVPTTAQIQDGIAYFEKLCEIKTGVTPPTKRRARICMIPGRHVCPTCRSTACRC